ncbi:MAG TPA: putative entry exclusion protein TrbK-alt [Pararhizobium sp.]|uniref:putative entry exclusion protein TrbK-alt n=1 Tax=Pararhizobium sp. TaxID=1977563 RepID=UPI002CDAFFCF|nr:putative entry exclusion protein TrbK-alt [Pararhizobium sp.]MCC7058818.1 putative entry exclusion protein TrbK-alt [Burkholderiaceae bacterium]HTO33380.1 putative entry exclusion protein TrbK-alt [Pararhizobium sp.]
MDTKLFARIGAGAFVAVALTMTVLELREEPRVPPPEIVTVFEPDGDPLPAQLKVCAAMGELALSAPDCRAAWAEKRRRFLGVEGKANEPPADADALLPASDAPEMKGQ